MVIVFHKVTCKADFLGFYHLEILFRGSAIPGGMRDPTPQPGTEAAHPAVEARILSRWATREVPPS